MRPLFTSVWQEPVGGVLPVLTLRGLGAVPFVVTGLRISVGCGEQGNHVKCGM